ncbi:MAG: hypothetical protein Q9228_007601, partial [Teloschistes exilis]
MTKDIHTGSGLVLPFTASPIAIECEDECVLDPLCAFFVQSVIVRAGGNLFVAM